MRQFFGMLLLFVLLGGAAVVTRPVERRNFSGQATPSVIALEYRSCNFSQAAPGTRIFPGDNRARTFVECNLVNAIPPPGSTLTRCNTTQVYRGVEDGKTTVTVLGTQAMASSCRTMPRPPAKVSLTICSGVSRPAAEEPCMIESKVR